MKLSDHLREFKGRIIIVGCGSIGQAMISMLIHHGGITPDRITAVDCLSESLLTVSAYNVAVVRERLTPESYRAVLWPLLQSGDFLLNLSVDVSSQELITFCHQKDAFYLDTCTEPWAGVYDSDKLLAAERTNYALREQVLSLPHHKRKRTAVITQGANPGLVSSFVKQALINMAVDTGVYTSTPITPSEWATLSCSLGVKVIHIAERDTQQSHTNKKRDEFVNTWSVTGFVSEGMQPAELGWGTHECHMPANGYRHSTGCKAAIFLDQPGAATHVKSWTPLEGSYQGFLITHAESISIADFLTLSNGEQLWYRPTVHYAYHPCDDAVLSIHELAGKNWQLQKQHRIIRDEIVCGMDELGVLLMGNPKGVYWYGSRLTTSQAQHILPLNNATSMQVVAGIAAGMTWAIANPYEGTVEPERLDHLLALDVAAPYLGEMIGVWSDWTPLRDQTKLYPSQSSCDPWQFANFLVS